jgi:hypothetical protein
VLKDSDIQGHIRPLQVVESPSATNRDCFERLVRDSDELNASPRVVYPHTPKPTRTNKQRLL